MWRVCVCVRCTFVHVCVSGGFDKICSSFATQCSSFPTQCSSSATQCSSFPTQCSSHTQHCNNLKTPYILVLLEFNFKVNIRERTDMFHPAHLPHPAHRCVANWPAATCRSYTNVFFFTFNHCTMIKNWQQDTLQQDTSQQDTSQQCHVYHERRCHAAFFCADRSGTPWFSAHSKSQGNRVRLTTCTNLVTYFRHFSSDLNNFGTGQSTKSQEAIAIFVKIGLVKAEQGCTSFCPCFPH
jgi:hypothetical protein